MFSHPGKTEAHMQDALLARRKLGQRLGDMDVPPKVAKRRVVDGGRFAPSLFRAVFRWKPLLFQVFQLGGRTPGINLWTAMVSQRAITLMGGHSLRENRMRKARCCAISLPPASSTQV